MKSINFRKIGRYLFRNMVVYFGPAIALRRLWKKHSWNYFRQIRVLYRYSGWK